MPESTERSPLGYIATRHRFPSMSVFRSLRMRWPVVVVRCSLLMMLVPNEEKWSNLNVNVEIVGGGILTFNRFRERRVFISRVCVCVFFVGSGAALTSLSSR